MLVRLFGSNFRSLKEPFELSMVAADLKRKEDRDRGVIEVPIAGMDEPLRLLRCVAIYGPNASGKSTVLAAANALNWLATETSAQARPDELIEFYEPFMLDKSSSRAPSELGCDIAHEGTILRYTLKYGPRSILRETLTLLDNRGEMELIDRQGSKKVGGDLIARSEANRLYVQGMQPNVAVLSKLAQHGPQQGKESVRPYYRAIRDATRWEDYSDATTPQGIIGELHTRRFAADDRYREWIMHHLIRTADVGIRSVKTRRIKPKIPGEIRDQFEKLGGASMFPDTRVLVSFVHEGDADRPIDLHEESSGTQKLFNIAGDWWTLAHESVTIFADELSASLHPRLLDRLIRAVNDAPTDRVRSQLIFTTHDTGLLESQDGLPPALRRDQVYFTKKDSKGATELYSLAEFKDDARPVHNIRKRYLSGLYGALPSVEKLSL